MVQTNPNGANGTTSDEREQICWDFYVESIAKGKVNAYESAIKSGYSEDHSRNITIQGWFKERLAKLKRKEMFSKAERNLDKALDTSYEDEEGRIKSDVMRIVVDVSKTVVQTLGKDEGYSGRQEITGANGTALNSYKDLSNDELAKIISESRVG